MKVKLVLCSLVLAFTTWAAVPELGKTNINVAGSLKLRKEFSLTKLDPLYFIEGFKKIEWSQINDKTIEVKVVFMNDIFNDENLEDPEKALKKDLDSLTNLPHQLSASLTGVDKEVPCQSVRRSSKPSKMTPDFVIESVRATLMATAMFHISSLSSTEVNKDEVSAGFDLVKRNVELSMDKIFGVEKKPSKEREELLKRYSIASKDLDAREALLKSLDLFDEAKGQFKSGPVTDKISIRLSVEKEGFAYILTINKA